MSTESQLHTIREWIEPMLEEDMFLVDMRIKPTNNIKIFLDADKGLPLERCIKVNRALYKKIEEAALYPGGDFSLEVSSPGVDEPLKLQRQFIKNVGRNVSVTLPDESIRTGKMIAADDLGFRISRTEGKGKKAVTLEDEFPYKDVKSVKVLISF
jgi:ribosome maturation factor RimP